MAAAENSRNLEVSDHTQQAPEVSKNLETDDPPTTACDTTMADHGLLAWSEGDEPDEPHRRSWLDAWGIAASVLVIGAVIAVVIFVVHTMGRHNDVAVSAPSTTTPPTWRSVVQPSAPVTTTTVTAPPVTVTATPTTQPAPTTTALRDGDGEQPTTTTAAVPVPQSNDDRYIDAVTRYGITVYSRPGLINNAHLVCGEVARGRTVTDMESDPIPAGTTLTPLAFDFLFRTAIAIYCPQYMGRE